MPAFASGPHAGAQAMQPVRTEQSPQTKEWSLQDCIDYALQNNISLQQSRITAESSAIDVKTARSALFPNLSFSTSHHYCPLKMDKVKN